MRSLLLLFLSFFAAFSMNASHLWGGDITWECQGNGTYVFQLTLYRDCLGIPLPTTTQNIDGPNGPITCSFVNSQEVLLPCFDPNQFNCSSTSIAGPVERYVYKSAPVSLSGVPPATGWEYSFSSCCRSYMQNSSSPGIFLNSTMYPGSATACASSAEFLHIDPIYSSGNGFISNTAIKANIADSLYFDLIDPMMSSGMVISFDSGYSAQAPFPDTSESSLNGPVLIDHNTGTIGLSIHSSYLTATELYVYAVAVETWRAGVLLSKVNREMVLVAYPNNAIAPNSKPIVSANTTNLTLPYAWVSSNKLRVLAQVGDTVDLDLNGFDTDFNTNMAGATIPQQTTFRWHGFAFDAALSGFVNTASVAPISPQASFVSAWNNNINFNWVIASEHEYGDQTSYFFKLLFTDDACPGGKTSFIDLEVVVSKSKMITPDSVQVCQGDSVQLQGTTVSGSYSWSPNLEISDVSVAAPWVSPSASRYYYLTDPNNQSLVDSVFVEIVAKKTFRLDSGASLMTLVDSVQSGTPTWFYNGIPFVNPYDTLSAFGPGYYWVQLVTPACKYTTDSIFYSPSSLSIPFIDPSNGFAATDLLSYSGAWNATISFNQMAYGYLYEVTIPGIVDLSGKTGGYDLTLELSDAGGQILLRIDTNVSQLNGALLRIPLDSVNYGLQANYPYQLSVMGDTGYAFSYYSGVQTPYDPYSTGMTITSIDIDGSPTNKVIPVILSVQNPISIDEFSENNEIQVYPNPTSAMLYFSGVEAGTEVKVMDLSGKMLLKEILSNELRMDLNGLSVGVYLLQLEGTIIKLQIH